MRKYFVVSDIHSFYEELIAALKQNDFDIDNPNHIFISCGDLFDRGNFPYETLSFIMSIPQERRILIRGNHEDLLEELLNGEREIGIHDVQNKTIATIRDIALLIGDKSADYDWYGAIKTVASNKLIREYLNSIVDFAEVEDKIFVHGWVPVDEKNKIIQNWEKADKKAWDEARWLNGMAFAHQGSIVQDKTIICGHYHCSWGWSHIRQSRKEFPSKSKSDWKSSFEPYCEKGICAIDSCVAYSGFINCICFEI